MTRTLGAVTYLNREDFRFPQGILKHYYEPKYDEVNYSVTLKPTWLPKYPEGIINSDGLRDRYNYQIAKDNNTYRIAALGDSWTFGLYVDIQKSYPERLEDELNEKLHCNGINKFEVINFGVPGHDVEYNVHRYFTKGEKYSPDLLLWLFTDVMLVRVNELYFPEMKPTPSAGPTLTLEKVGKISLEAYFNTLIKYGEHSLLEYSLSAMKKITTAKTPIVLLVFPSMIQEYKKVIYDFAETKINSHVVENIPDIPKDPKLHFAPFDNHPNSQGYKLLSEAIYNYIRSNVLTSCAELTTF